MARNRLKHTERELAMLVMIERQLAAFVKAYTRAQESHDPFRRALEHAVEQRTLLTMALAGDSGAQRARRMQDGNANRMGE